MNSPVSAAPQQSTDPRQITRPDSALMRYYLLVSLLTGPGFFLAILPLWFKYETLRYRFDDEGISISWGILFRREVHLTYRRIQDIHLTRNLLQRWMGLATVSVQTAAGSANPEGTIEGVLAADELRDFLYAKMRGVREHPPEATAPEAAAPPSGQAAADGEPLVLLREIRDALLEVARRREAKP
ncbi:MAG TPA: PH domain-containing protein [Pirellulales bacterium]|nr:PH domain-containing protein [Pirellulales bacterium]